MRKVLLCLGVLVSVAAFMDPVSIKADEVRDAVTVEQCEKDHQESYNYFCTLIVNALLGGIEANKVGLVQMYWCDAMTAIDKRRCDCLYTTPWGVLHERCTDRATELNNTCNDEWDLSRVSEWGCLYLPPPTVNQNLQQN